MDLAADPYLVDVDGEANDEDLFGNDDAVEADNVGPGEETHAPVIPGDALDDNVDLDEDVQVENAENRILPCPNEPTPSHIEDHRAEGHIPYRNWCSECVRARWTGDQHRKRRDRRGICVFSFDYLHLDKTGIPVAKRAVLEGAEVDLTILVAKDSLGKAVFGHVVPQKGIDPEHYSVDALMEDIKWLGYTALSLRSDNEPAILKLLKHALTESRIHVEHLERIQEEHPVDYDHAGNGEIEAAVKQLTGILRTNKLDLERRINKEVPLSHPLMTWLVEYSAWMITIRVVGKDGLVAFQRVRKRPFHKRLLPYGELVNVHLPSDGPDRAQRGALDARAVEGIMLGYSTVSHAYKVWLPHLQKVKTMRSISRLPLSQRWCADKVSVVNVCARDEHTSRGARAVPLTDREPRLEDLAVPGKSRTARRLELRQADFDPLMGGYGWTEHCPKCDHARMYGWRSASTAQHSVMCRARIEGELNNTARGRERLAHTKERFERREAAKTGNRESAEDTKKEGQEGPPSKDQTGHRSDAGGDNIAPTVADDQEVSSSDDGMTVDSDSGDDPMPAYEPSSPMSVQHLAGSQEEPGDEDLPVQAVMNLVTQDEKLTEEMTDINKEILELVAQLGGNPKEYRRERGRAIQNLVAEIYSAPRITRALKMMPNFSLVPGFALDLSGQDEAGNSWDFTRADMRAKAREMVTTLKPLFVVGCPPCTAFCNWNTLNAARHGWTDQEIRRRKAEGELHLRFCCEIYQLQLQAGRYFVHEHPAHATTSWSLSEVQAILKDSRVGRVVGDQCQYGQQTSAGQPIMKPIGWMSNSPAILQQLAKRCGNRAGQCNRAEGGRHAVASGKIAREAAVYPFRLCRAILRGCQKQLRLDGRLGQGSHGMQAQYDEEIQTFIEEAQAMEQESDTVEILAWNKAHQQAAKVIRDAISGQPLDPSMVHAAMKLEMEYFESKQVWQKVPRSEALARGKKPISTRWIIVNKGDDDSPNIRARLVAREIRKAGEDPIFAPTPPLESLRTILSLAATDFHGMPRQVRDPQSPDRTQVSFIDISRAYFCASTDPDDYTYVELPPEDPDHGMKVGRLLKHMYGTRKAADGWHCEYAGRLVEDLGFEVGDASACVFLHRERELRCSVHGDDITTVGSKTNLDWLKGQLEKLYELKEAHRLGPADDDDKEATVLNRIVRWTKDGLEYEADPRQGEKLLRDLKLDGPGVKDVASPGVKATKEQLEADQPLETAKHTPYRAVVARSNYLSSDRPELQFSGKEVCRWMSSPTELALKALKRIGRYVTSHQRLVFYYPWQTVARIDTYSDTDWSGCPKTRKSTSGGCLMLGTHLIKSWSSTQTSVSLSSGEAEFYGVVKASGISLGYQALLRDLGHVLPVRVWTDSTATIGICGRQGLGKLRHVDTQCLWIQQRVRDRTIELVKVRGEENPADLFTKHLTSRQRIHDLLAMFGCRYATGRAATAPKLREGTGTTKGELLSIVAGERSVSWNGQEFPAVEFEGELLPEAFASMANLLPHLHADEQRRYPRARVDHCPEDRDPESHDGLELRGALLGKTYKSRRQVAAPKAGMA